MYGGEIYTNTVKIPVEDKQFDAPDDDNRLPVYGEVNIFDGGLIISGPTDDVPEVDDSNPSDEPTIVEDIINNQIPFYRGIADQEYSVSTYQKLDGSTSSYTDEGFYTNYSGGKVTDAGYQMTFEGNTDSIAQTFAMYSVAKIITAYQYQPAFNQWIDMGFDGTYWVETGTTTKIVNGKEIIFTEYAYNVELMGDAITAPEYWRFEVEVE